MSTAWGDESPSGSATIDLLRALALLGPRLHEPPTSGSPEALFALVCDTLRDRRLDTHVTTLDANGALRVAATSMGAEILGQVEQLLGTNFVGLTMPSGWPYDAVLASGEALVVEALPSVAAPFLPHLDIDHVAELLRVVGAELAIIAPIGAGGRNVALLTMWIERSQLAAADASAVAALGAQMGIALENARLYREAETERARWRATVDSMEDCVVTCDADGQLTYANATFEGLFGRGADASLAPQAHPLAYGLYGPDGGLYAWEDLPLNYARRTQTCISDVEVIVRRADGFERPTIWSGSPIRDEHGTLLGAVAVGRDITDQRRLEGHSQSALNVLLHVLHIVTDPTIWSNAQTLLTRVAEALHELEAADYTRAIYFDESGRPVPLALFGGLAADERHWKEAMRSLSPAAAANLGEFTNVLRTGRMFLQDFRTQEPTFTPETVRTLGLRASITAPVLVADRLVGTLSIGHSRSPDPGTDGLFAPWEEDVVAGVARLAAEALTRGKLAERLTAADAARLAADEAMRHRNEFLTIAAHELRTPLTSLKSYAQYANRRASSGLASGGDVASLETTITSLQRALGRIEHSANRLQLLVADLVDVLRIEADRLELRSERCDLSTICREAAEDQRQITGRTIRLSLPKAAILVEADADRVGQVVTNLVSNAVKYSLADQPVKLTLGIAGDEAIVSVRDHGPGLPPDEFTHVFERFYRAPGVEVQSGSHMGLGLGLYISRQIVERHGGRIWVESAPGKGSTFIFALPLHRAPGDAE
jgi:signal transduction histidine kinase/PAS domain-containing protein